MFAAVLPLHCPRMLSGRRAHDSILQQHQPAKLRVLPIGGIVAASECLSLHFLFQCWVCPCGLTTLWLCFVIPWGFLLAASFPIESKLPWGRDPATVSRWLFHPQQPESCLACRRCSMDPCSPYIRGGVHTDFFKETHSDDLVIFLGNIWYALSMTGSFWILVLVEMYHFHKGVLGPLTGE